MSSVRLVHSLGPLVACVAMFAAPGCAPKQRVPLECVPEQVTVYVDGRALEQTPEALELRSDRPHKIFVKGPGFEPRLLVLEPRDRAEGEPRLEPGRVCVELVPVGMERDLELTVEDPDGTP